MQTIRVDTSSRSYEVRIGHDLLREVGPVARVAAGGERAMLVSDTNVMPLFGRKVRCSLEAAGYVVSEYAFEAGEKSKNMVTLTQVLDHIARAGLTRDDVVVALGGGVVGDLAGFAAACYMRGCAVVQVPTSLLAMVDSSVGGKTAVDLGEGKNLAGAFWQPAAVVADIDCLASLAPALYRDSLGEVIKCGVLRDRELFCSLEEKPLLAEDLPADLELPRPRIEDVIVRCVELKRDVVDADEREGGVRQTLNLGHTAGHAIEAESGYALGHGSCVAAGLCVMARACAAEGLCTDEVARRIADVVAAHRLPTGTSISVGRLYQRSLADKKRHGGRMNIVAVRDIGQVEVRGIALGEYRRLLELGCPTV